MTFNTDIEKTEKEIAVLQAKLELLKEIEVHKSQVEKEPDMMLMRQGNVDIVDYDHKVYYRIEYTDSFSGTYVWFVRRRGDENIRQVRDVNVYGVLEDYYQKQVLKQKEEYPYKKDEIEWDEKDNPKPKQKTLYTELEEYGFTKPSTIHDICDAVSNFLPVSYEPHGDYGEGWNDCLNQIRENLK